MCHVPRALCPRASGDWHGHRHAHATCGATEQPQSPAEGALPTQPCRQPAVPRPSSGHQPEMASERHPGPGGAQCWTRGGTYPEWLDQRIWPEPEVGLGPVTPCWDGRLPTGNPGDPASPPGGEASVQKASGGLPGHQEAQQVAQGRCRPQPCPLTQAASASSACSSPAGIRLCARGSSGTRKPLSFQH